MKVAIPALLVVGGMSLASCAISTEPQTSSEESAVILLPPSKTTQSWSLKSDYDAIWPTGQGIDTTYVLIKKGYPAQNGDPATFLAFVVWDNNTLGHVYQVHYGTEGQDFRETVAGALAVRTANNLDHSGGSTGSGEGGTVIPRPHPSGGDPQVIVSPQEVLNALNTSAALDDAVRNTFFSYN